MEFDEAKYFFSLRASSLLNFEGFSAKCRDELQQL